MKTLFLLKITTWVNPLEGLLACLGRGTKGVGLSAICLLSLNRNNVHSWSYNHEPYIISILRIAGLREVEIKLSKIPALNAAILHPIIPFNDPLQFHHRKICGQFLDPHRCPIADFIDMQAFISQ